MIITDAEGRIIYVNDSALRINGYTRQEILGTKAGKKWGGQMPKTFYASLWHQVKEKRESFISRLTNRRKNGQLYEAEITISPLFDDFLRFPVGYVAIEREVSDQPVVAKRKPSTRPKHRHAIIKV